MNFFLTLNGELWFLWQKNYMHTMGKTHNKAHQFVAVGHRTAFSGRCLRRYVLSASSGASRPSVLAVE